MTDIEKQRRFGETAAIDETLIPPQTGETSRLSF